MAAGSSATPPPPSPPPPTLPSAAKKGFLRSAFPFLLAANLAVGVYVFVRTSQKNSTEEEEAKKGAPNAPSLTTESAIQKPASEPVAAAIKVLPPIPEQEQRMLFEWILEEKRKVKPTDKVEKKKLDEEKGLLKQFIRAKYIPSL